jgi:hypothetical protein
MATINMNQFFDLRIVFRSNPAGFSLRGINSQGKIQFQTPIPAGTHELSISGSGPTRFLNINSSNEEDDGFSQVMIQNTNFHFSFFREVAGIPMTGIIGTDDYRPTVGNPLRLVKIDGSSTCFLQIKLEGTIWVGKIKYHGAETMTIEDFLTPNYQALYVPYLTTA